MTSKLAAVFLLGIPLVAPPRLKASRSRGREAPRSVPPPPAVLPARQPGGLGAAPGRALGAEAESVIVRVDARRGNALYVNDGAFGTLFDAAYAAFRFPARLGG